MKAWRKRSGKNVTVLYTTAVNTALPAFMQLIEWTATCFPSIATSLSMLSMTMALGGPITPSVLDTLRGSILSLAQVLTRADMCAQSQLSPSTTRPESEKYIVDLSDNLKSGRELLYTSRFANGYN